MKAAAYPGANDILGADGVVTSADKDKKVDSLAQNFIKAIGHHRFWSRELKSMPA